MWRSSSLRRSLPALLSKLPHRSSSMILPGRSATSAAFGKSYLNPAYSSPIAAAGTGQRISNNADQLLQQRRQQRHLYVAQDNSRKGFSLHKLGLDDLLFAGDEPQHLPDPVLRLDVRTVGSPPRFHALGRNIVVTDDSYFFQQGNGLTLIYDTETGALNTDHSLPRELWGMIYDAVPVGDKLYALNYCHQNKHIIPYLCQAQTQSDHHHPPRYVRNLDRIEVVEDIPRQRRWAWERCVSAKPVADGFISAYALHPDGRTIFVSFRACSSPYEDMGTFSLDTDTADSIHSGWTHRGDWCLPFRGQAHYDGDLGAWIGTRYVRDKRSYRDQEHLCLCGVVPVDQDGVTPEPAWKVVKEGLTFLEPSLKPMNGRRTLVRTGGGGVFCLVEHAEHVDKKVRGGAAAGCLLNVTMFRTSYGSDGEPVPVPLWPGRSYMVTPFASNFNAPATPAFWI